MLDKLTSMVLYVPYHMDYSVPQEVRDRLTESEFFDHCYVDTDFEKEIERLKNAKKIQVDDTLDGSFIWENAVIEEIRKLESFRESKKTFERWIEENGNGIFCIRGDAGTGKTTFLHHLQYQYRKDNIPLVWEIIDVQKAHTPVRVISCELNIENFSLLESKVIAALIDNIFCLYFSLGQSTVETGSIPKKGIVQQTKKLIQSVFHPNTKLNRCRETQLIAENLRALFQSYQNNVRESFPTEEVNWFFDESELFTKKASLITDYDLSNAAQTLCSRIENMIKSETSEQALGRLLNIYMTILRSRDNCVKHIVALDNIERIIGDDEIYNTQIVALIEKLKHKLDSACEQINDFYKFFQMVVLMRNTSSRMSHMPLHRIDFQGHELNLSGWFPIDKIVSNKLRWYDEHNIAVEDGSLVSTIIGEKSFDGCGPRSLQMKLGMLFNNNNRVIMSLISKAVNNAKAVNPYTLSVLDMFIDNSCNMPEQLTRFAARSIFIRLLLDVLRDDGLFKNILVQVEYSKESTKLLSQSDGESIITDESMQLGYARRILTILYNFSLENSGYMPFDVMIQKLSGGKSQHLAEYYDDNNVDTRRIVAKILYFMNYYNSRKKNWLHFVDIQCNVNTAQELKINDEEDLMELIDEKHQMIGIRIMSAGAAFLHYIIQSFEYFSCRIKAQNLPPLLCLIPTLEDLRKCSKIDELKCILVIKRTAAEAFSCFELMDERNGTNNDFKYRRTLDTLPIDYKTRIINAHEGYINNFSDCVKAYYENNPNLTSGDRGKLNDLYECLRLLRKDYVDKLVVS